MAEMLTIMRQCVTCKIQVLSCKVKVTLLGETSKVGYFFCVRSITLSFLDGFLNYLAEMFTIMRQCVICKAQIHSCKVKVTLRGQRSKIGYNFCVQSITLSFPKKILKLPDRYVYHYGTLCCVPYPG